MYVYSIINRTQQAITSQLYVYSIIIRKQQATCKRVKAALLCMIDN
jgi:hypothetical protein